MKGAGCSGEMALKGVNDESKCSLMYRRWAVTLVITRGSVPVMQRTQDVSIKEENFMTEEEEKEGRDSFRR